MKLSHIDEDGKSRMVDVTEKSDTHRTATAVGWIEMNPETLQLLMEGKMAKGRNVLEVARVAAIMAVKKTHELIPMCHPLLITGAEVDFDIDKEKNRVNISVTAKLSGKTGIEMEALTGVSVAGLTIYDMCKAVDKEMVIGDIKLMKKTGGKSGTFIRES